MQSNVKHTILHRDDGTLEYRCEIDRIMCTCSCGINFEKPVSGTVIPCPCGREHVTCPCGLGPSDCHNCPGVWRRWHLGEREAFDAAEAGNHFPLHSQRSAT